MTLQLLSLQWIMVFVFKILKSLYHPISYGRYIELKNTNPRKVLSFDAQFSPQCPWIYRSAQRRRFKWIWFCFWQLLLQGWKLRWWLAIWVWQNYKPNFPPSSPAPLSLSLSLSTKLEENQGCFSSRITLSQSCFYGRVGLNTYMASFQKIFIWFLQFLLWC